MISLKNMTFIPDKNLKFKPLKEEGKKKGRFFKLS